MGEVLRYAVLAIQTANANATVRQKLKENLERCLELIDLAFVGYENFGFPIKLVAFPEFFIHGLPYLTTKEYLESDILVGIPGEETDALAAYAKKHGCYIVSGSFLEYDPKWPKHVFNMVCIIGPEGVITRYRKVQPWVPLETFSSPHSLQGYDEELFPVADLPIGKIAAAICYDWIFPEPFREFAFKGAEVMVRASAYMHPFTTEEPMNWWTAVAKVRALENVCYGVHFNQGAALKDFPAYSWPGGTCIVDYQGRVLSQIYESGEHIVYGTIDLANLREWRAKTYTHLMPAHLRTEAYTYLKKPIFPAAAFRPDEEVTVRLFPCCS
ncbi:MAG: nitrilase-related carbon-nitrogen hydrolase [Desulfotomaculales bacterium]